MLKDAKKLSHHRGTVKGAEKHKEDLEDLPFHLSSRPRGVWREGGGLSYAAICRWLAKKVGTRFRLSEAPVEWREEIKEKLRREKAWHFENPKRCGDCFVLGEDGILRFFESPHQKYRQCKTTLPYLEEGPDKYICLLGIWYKATITKATSLEKLLHGFWGPRRKNRPFLIIGDVTYLVSNRRQVESKLQHKLTAMRKGQENENS